MPSPERRGGNATALQCGRRTSISATPEDGSAQEPHYPRSSSAARGETKVARLTRERDEALQQQTATADVLKIIDRSTFDLQAVLLSRATIVGRSLLEGRTIHVPDAQADPDYKVYGVAVLGVYRTVLCVPLLRQGVPIGVIALTRPFTEKQIKLVETFADQAVIAIENTRLFEAEQLRTRELTESLEQQTAASEVLQLSAALPATFNVVRG